VEEAVVDYVRAMQRRNARAKPRSGAVPPEDGENTSDGVDDDSDGSSEGQEGGGGSDTSEDEHPAQGEA